MNEIALTALATLCAVGIPAGIAFYFKTYLPWRQAQVADQQEHSQTVETKDRTYQNLQASWRDDKLATLLEMDSSFIRETIHRQLLDQAKVLNNMNTAVLLLTDEIRELKKEKNENAHRS